MSLVEDTFKENEQKLNEVCREHDLCVEMMNDIYHERDLCLATLAHIALDMGYPVGMGRYMGEDCNDEWRNILFIELPTGQCSWYMHDSEMKYFRAIPNYMDKWDGHSTEEKYERVKKFCRNQIHILHMVKVG